MTRATANYILAGIFAAGLAGFGLWLWSTRETAPEPIASTEEEPLPEGSVRLLFPGADNLLHAEDRVLAEEEPGRGVPREGGSRPRLHRAVEELLEGPGTEGLFPAFPEGTELVSILVTENGTAIVDLTSGEGAPPPSSGSTQELLSVYSVVNTVLVNAPNVRGVVLLWNGQHRPTLSGHVDLTRPLALDRSLVVRALESVSGP